jgi:hypothetical protein
VIKVDGFEMVKTMAANVEVMMQHKIDAIKVINYLGILNFKKAVKSSQVNDFLNKHLLTAVKNSLLKRAVVRDTSARACLKILLIIT